MDAIKTEPDSGATTFLMKGFEFVSIKQEQDPFNETEREVQNDSDIIEGQGSNSTSIEMSAIESEVQTESSSKLSQQPLHLNNQQSQQPQQSTSTTRQNVNQQSACELSPAPSKPPSKTIYRKLQPGLPANHQKQSQIPEHIGRAITSLQSLKENCMKKDPDDDLSHFGRNVAAQLRQLPLFDALVVQTDIMNLIIKRRKQVVHRSQFFSGPSN